MADVKMAAPTDGTAASSGTSLENTAPRSVSLGPVKPSPAVPAEQLLYARILRVGMFTGMAVLAVTFALYAGGFLPRAVPRRQLYKYWGMNIHDYLLATNRDYVHHAQPVTSWSWLSIVTTADYLNYVGIVLLSGVTIFCFLGIIPLLVRKKDWLYAVMSLLEAAMLILAASGLLCCGA